MSFDLLDDNPAVQPLIVLFLCIGPDNSHHYEDVYGPIFYVLKSFCNSNRYT